MERESDIDETTYKKVCEWCWKRGRRAPMRDEKDMIKRNVESMKTLGCNPYK